MLQLINASLGRGSKLLFEDASLQVHPGQRLGLVGVNGSGKSSLFSLILGELETDAGEIKVDPRDLIAHVSQESPSTDRQAIDFVMDGDRELRQLQWEIAAIEEAGFDSASHNRLHELHERMDVIDGYTAPARAARLLNGLGFGEQDLKRAVTRFSGGWRMRLNLAQALMCRSDLLLLDEPTNHLDLPAILWLERWLLSYPGMLLLIAHDRDFLDGLCTHIAHIDQQSIRLYVGNYSQFERIRSQQLAQQQSLHKKQQKEIRHIQGYIDRFRYKASKAKQAQSRLRMLERMTLIAPAHVDSQFHFQFLEPKRQPQHLLSLEDVSAGYTQAVVRDVRLGIQAGSRIGLLGMNGAGKSTLLKTLVDGSTLLSGERTVHRHTRIGYFAQHQLDLLRMDCSPLWHVRQQAPDYSEQDLRNHLGKFGFRGDRIDEPTTPFSGGEKARLVLAMLILQRPNLLLLDEPTNHLDLDMRHALSMALVDYGGALLVISHDRHLLHSVCDELYIVHDGRLMEFRQDLDAYPGWLREQASQSVVSGKQPAKSQSRKQLRRTKAAQRNHVEPQRKRLRKIEQNMAQNRLSLETLENQLAEENLYTQTTRKAELADLVRQQASLRKKLESLELDWLEATEMLESVERKTC